MIIHVKKCIELVHENHKLTQPLSNSKRKATIAGPSRKVLIEMNLETWMSIARDSYVALPFQKQYTVTTYIN